MSKGAIAAILTVVLGLVVLGIVILSLRRPAARTVARSGGSKWEVIGQGIGLGSGLAASWLPGRGTPSVGGKQVTTQTGDYLYQGTPNPRQGLQGYSYGDGYSSGSWGAQQGGGQVAGGYQGTALPASTAGKLDSLGSGGDDWWRAKGPELVPADTASGLAPAPAGDSWFS